MREEYKERIWSIVKLFVAWCIQVGLHSYFRTNGSSKFLLAFLFSLIVFGMLLLILKAFLLAVLVHKNNAEAN